MQAPLGSVHPDGQQPCCLHTFLKALCTCSLPPCSDLICGFYDLCFDLSQSRELKHVCETASKSHKIPTSSAVGVICEVSYIVSLQTLAFPDARSPERFYLPPLTFFCFYLLGTVLEKIMQKKYNSFKQSQYSGFFLTYLQKEEKKKGKKICGQEYYF